MNLTSELIPIIGPVVAATIAGAIAFLASVFTKESKVSEFRQAWIDGLRNDVAEFVSVYHFISADIPEAAKADMKSIDWSRSLKDEFLKIEEMQARIELRLNPHEHGSLIHKLRHTVKLDIEMLQDHSLRVDAVNAIIAETQEILKKEWVRVKTGERTYRVTRRISLALVVVSVLAGLGVAIYAWCAP